MSKSISKTEATKIIKEVEALEFLIQTIDRNETNSSKQSRVNRFINDVQRQLKDDRDVILLGIKLK